jgi:hypothetical protein
MAAGVPGGPQDRRQERPHVLHAGEAAPPGGQQRLLRDVVGEARARDDAARERRQPGGVHEQSFVGIGLVHGRTLEARRRPPGFAVLAKTTRRESPAARHGERWPLPRGARCL